MNKKLRMKTFSRRLTTFVNHLDKLLFGGFQIISYLCTPNFNKYDIVTE